MLCRELHCLPSQIDAESAEDVEDLLLIMDLYEKYAPKQEAP